MVTTGRLDEAQCNCYAVNALEENQPCCSHDKLRYVYYSYVKCRALVSKGICVLTCRLRLNVEIFIYLFWLFCFTFIITYVIYVILISYRLKWNVALFWDWFIRGIFQLLSKLTHCGLVTPYGDRDLGQHWYRYSLLPDGTKPLPEPILTQYQWHSSQCNFTENA